MKIDLILGQIDLGKMALPEFQRGYVWNRDQVRGLMDSLYRRHPVGSLLVWETTIDSADIRGDAQPPVGNWVDLLLDGQQRITTLYGIMRGRPPKFFDGNAAAFTGLHFNMGEEIFEFYAPLKMKDNPLWVDVTRVMNTHDLEEIIDETATQRIQELGLKPMACMNRLHRVQSIRDIEFHIDRVSGPDKTIDVVVDIFNRVNSGGTKLSKGDLALAKICASWPEARNEMKSRLTKWERAGFRFRLEWYLRCINALVTGEALFAALAKVETPAFQHGVSRAEKQIDAVLNLISSRLGLDHDEVLGSRYSIPLLVRYLEQCGGSAMNRAEQDKLLYWYVHTFLWGRYAGSTESVLNQDLELIEVPTGGVDRLIGQLRQNRGSLELTERDFHGWSRGARFYPLLYMLTRVHEARDWGNGWVLNKQLLGNQSTLHMHHIFPKALLYKHGYSRPEANALANFTFLTAETNLEISDRDPQEYLPIYLQKHPGAIASHWIPMDPALWRVENYREFLSARRALLADAANQFLNGLLGGGAQQEPVAEPVLERTGIGPRPLAGAIASEDEEREIAECNRWIREQELPEGEVLFELIDAATNDVTALLDLAWPDGLQPGLSQPVALLIDESAETEEAANSAGFRYFTSIDDLRRYVRSEILALDLSAV